MGENLVRRWYDGAASESDMSYDEVSRHYAYALPENAVTFDNLGDMRRRVIASGSHFFDRDAIRFFRGKTDTHFYGRRFWVESRKFWDNGSGQSEPREYMVAWVSDYDGHLSVERRGLWLTLNYARAAARTLAQYVTALES